MGADPSISTPIKRRKVFYCPGYDPFPARRYRELHRKEGARQAEISGFEFTQSARKEGPYGWTVTATMDGHEVFTDFEILEWSDIVQDSMTGGVIATYALMARTAWAYLSTGALKDLRRLRRGPVIVALYPVLILTLQAIIAALLGWMGASILADLNIHWALQAIAAFGIITLTLRVFRKLDRKIFAYYLMYDYGFFAQFQGAAPPALTERLAAFLTRVQEAAKGDWDEVLIVGHSSGAQVGLQTIARGIEGAGFAKPLSFLTLGQVFPMVAFLPKADDLRADMRAVGRSDALTWVDITAPTDPCCFALCDPLKVSGIEDAIHPLVLSAAFKKAMAPARFKAMKRRFFKLHFQYLCAFEAPDNYDYFSITSGPMLLRDRFKDVPQSPSRITTNASRYGLSSGLNTKGREHG